MFDVLRNEVLSLHLFPIWRTVHEPHQIRLVNKERLFSCVSDWNEPFHTTATKLFMLVQRYM